MQALSIDAAYPAIRRLLIRPRTADLPPSAPRSPDLVGVTHSHGDSTHSHLPPGADGRPVTWRTLLALGVSGGLLPCPSALVAMLSAIARPRVRRACN